MTILAAEAAGATTAGAEISAGAGAGAGTARAAKGAQGTRARDASGQAAQFGSPRGSKSARKIGRARVPTGNRRYQGVILAEFLVAVLIVGVAPLARGKAAQDTTGGPSPYGPDDIKQLAGIGAVYFVLALLSSGKHGRISAWFGGLVLVAIGLSETVSGGLPAIFGIFQPSGKSAGAGEVTPAQEQQILNQAAAAAQSGAKQYVTFTQPGVATTTETTPGVIVT